MRIREIATIKPLTPQQSRIKNLKQAKDNASKALKVERERQKITKAQQAITKARQQLN